MAIYNYITFAQAKQQLASRLYDATKQFWSDAELGVYLQESMRTWNALTAYWRGDFTFLAQQNVTWYDLTDTSVMPNTLRPYTLTDADLYTAIQYHLLEPVGPINPWTGVSAQFSADDVISAALRRRDELLSVTGCTLTRRVVPAVPGRIQLPDTVVDVRRLAFLIGSQGTWQASEPDAFIFNPLLNTVYPKPGTLNPGGFQGESASVLNADLGADHFAEATVAVLGTIIPGINNSVSVCTGMTIDPATGLISCYLFGIRRDGGYSLTWEVNILPGTGLGPPTDFQRGPFPGFPDRFDLPFGVGHVIRLELSGNQLTAKLDGTIVFGPLAADLPGAPFGITQLTGHHVGVEGYPTIVGLANSIQLSNFRCGSLPSGPVQVPLLVNIGDATIPNHAGVLIHPDDTWGEQSFDRNYLQQPSRIPSTYLMSTEPPISFDTDAAPPPGGNYELLTVETNASIDMGILVPDDWVHVIKWGALADLLSRESNAKDPLRAAYCEQRYRMGLALLSSAPALLAMRSGNVPLQVDAVSGADQFQTTWQAAVSGVPEMALHAGLNKLALSPAADIKGPHSLTATVVQNAPVPTVDGDPLQVARDDLDVILDYAQHLAAFKMGGAEFLATIPLLQRFMKKAEVYGLKLAELGEYTSVLYALSQRENQMNPRMAPSSDDGSGGGNG